MTDLNKAMDAIANLEDKNKVAVKGGKFYTQVVTRVEIFRRQFGLEYGINTQITEFSGGVLARAWIEKTEDSGMTKTVGEGHAYAHEISKEKCIEKLETTAIGRALASIGLSGGEYCSQNELDTYEERYEKPTQEHREAQLEALDGLYNYDGLADFDAYQPDVSSLPDILRKTYENQRDICRQQIEAGVIPECPGYRFIGVDHATRWAISVPATLNGMSAQFEIDKWVEINQRRIDALDVILKGKIHVKNEKTTGERLQGLIDQRKLEVEKGEVS